MIENIISDLVDNPTEKNKEKYLNYVTKTEYSLLQDAETLPYKSQEYFNKRTEAFSYRRNCAIMLLNSWIKIHKTTENAPVTYADTLNIPFKKIKRQSD